ncbi:hypothetical protein Tco_0283133 [Tanacetum coccineum]
MRFALRSLGIKAFIFGAFDDFNLWLARVKDLSNHMCLVYGFGRACVVLSLFLEHCTMTTPCPTPFLATTPHAKVFTPFVIIFDSDDEITSLPVRPAPPPSDHSLALYGYPLDSSDDSLDEDLSETVEKGDPYASPPSLLPSSSSPPSSLLPFSSRKRSRSPSPPPLPLPPLPSPSPAILPPPPKVVIPEATTTATLARLRRIVEACRWNFVNDGIDTWRQQEGEPRYEMGESSLAHIHPITSEPIHRTIPLLVARLVHHDEQIEEIRDH